MPHRRIDRAARWLAWLVGGAAFAWVLHRANVRDAIPVIAKAGPILALGLVPFFVQLALDALAWRALLAGLGRRVAWRRLLAVRLATEAVLLTVPGGSLVGESLKPYLLRRVADVPIAETVATVAVKRALLTVALATYLALAWLTGRTLYAAASASVTGTAHLAGYVAGVAALVAGLGGLALAALLSATFADRVRRALSRLPSRRLSAALERRRAAFQVADDALVRLRRPAVLATGFGLLVTVWLCEAVETYLLLRLVGVELALPHVLAIEAVVVVARNAAFFVPAGLGVQDAGYLAFLGASGVAPALSAAFLVAKRGKELVWIAVGYGVLVVLDRRYPAVSAVSVAVQGGW